MADYWSVISPGGEQSVDFLHTASVDGITLRDGNGFSLSALSGHDYLQATPQPPIGIPEPGALTLVRTALGGLALRRRKPPRAPTRRDARRLSAPLAYRKPLQALALRFPLNTPFDPIRS